MTKLAPVRNEAGHRQAMRRVEEIFNAEPGTEAGDELDVLTTLIELYERASIPSPSPIAAIKFRMAQQRLTPRDLEPYIGSRARVSEILSGERNLTVDMMRALRRHLGIPAEVLLGETPTRESEHIAEPSRQALTRLSEAGWLRRNESFAQFVSRGFGSAFRPAMLRKTRTDRTNSKTDGAALQGWCAAALIKSRKIKVARRTAKTNYDADMGREIAKLSSDPGNIHRLKEFLSERGIAFVILRHLPGTYLDGAAMRRDDDVPVIALTLRHDRIDNFWFTVLHEFAHVACHLDGDTNIIIDDLDIRSAEAIEAQADLFAQKALIPDVLTASLKATAFEVADAMRLAEQAGVHIAIVAGRWQREHRDYRKFSKLVGHGEIRARFDTDL